jgi:hypothetical protein
MACHGMAHPQVANGGMAGAANMLNKQSWTAEKGGPAVWGWGRVLTTPHLKKVRSCHQVKTYLVMKRSRTCKCGNELSDSIKCREFLDQLKTS